MLDNHSIELINAGVDGELDDQEMKELDALLDSSSEARELHGELLRMSNFLGALPEQQPPPELKRQILDRIKLPRQPALFSLHGVFVSFRPLATATAFAAGLMVAIGVYELSPRQFSAGDLDKMVGTAVLNGPVGNTGGAGRQHGQLKLDEDWISGTISLQETKGLYVLDFDLDSAGPVQIGLPLREAGLAFAGIAQEGDQPGSVNEEFRVSGGDFAGGKPGTAILRRIPSKYH